MIDFSFIKEIHLNLGAFTIDFGQDKSRREFSIIIALIGVLLIVLTGTPLGAYLPQIIRDILISIGILFLITGGFLHKVRTG